MAAGGGITDAFVDAFAGLFAGRRDAHGAKEGLCVRKSVTREVYRGHLLGHERLGIYPIAGENLDRCRWGCIDFDIDDHTIAFLAQRSAITRFGAFAHVERSRSKGWHVWFFFSEWVLAADVRSLLYAVLTDLSDELELRALPVPEVFPKQDALDANDPRVLGNYVNLPLFGRDTTNGRTCFYDEGSSGPVRIPWSPMTAATNGGNVLDSIRELAPSARPRPKASRNGSPAAGGSGPNLITDPNDRRAYGGELAPCARRMFSAGLRAGNRNEGMFRLGIHLKHGGYDQPSAANYLRRFNDERVQPPMDEKELDQTIGSSYKATGANDSYGCENDLIRPFCALAECPIYRANHPEATRVESHEPPPAESYDPSKIRLVEFSAEESRFEFARGEVRYTISSLSMARGTRRGLVVITRGGQTIYRDMIAVESEQARQRAAKRVFKDHAVTGIDTDLMNAASAIEARLTEEVTRAARDRQQARRKVLTAEESEAATRWAAERPDILWHLIEATSRAGMVRELANRCLLYLMFTSRKLANPICGVGKGDSSSGKSHLAKSVLAMIPQEDVEELTRATASALYYADEYAYVHKVLFFREAAGSSEGSDHAMRTFISEGDLILQTVMKTPSGELEAVKKHVRGPLCTYSTTTDLEGNPENETRLFSVFSDESEAMTREVMLPVAYSAKHGPLRIPEQEALVWHNFQRILEPDPLIIVPFGSRLIDGFPTRQLRSRRDFSRLIELVKASAYVHQFHRRREPMIDREGNPRNAIIASVADYAIAKQIAEGVLMKSSLGVRQGFEDMLAVLAEITAEAVAFRERNGRNLDRTIYSAGGEDEDPTVWVQTPLLRDRLGYNARQVRRVAEGLEGEGLVAINHQRRPLQVALAREASFGDGGFALPTISVDDLLESYPQDRAHIYDPLTAPDFRDVYGSNY